MRREKEERLRKLEKCLIDANEVGYMLGITSKEVMDAARANELPRPVVIQGKSRWRPADIKRFIRLLKPQWADSSTAFLESYLPADKLPFELEEYEGKILEYDLRIKPCIYFLIDKHQVTYVGQSICLPARILQHKQGGKSTPKKDFDRVLFMPLPLEKLSSAEKALIQKIRPILNYAHKPSDVPDVLQ